MANTTQCELKETKEDSPHLPKAHYRNRTNNSGLILGQRLLLNIQIKKTEVCCKSVMLTLKVVLSHVCLV